MRDASKPPEAEALRPEENRHASAYRKEWAALTGKPEREIYVPFALRTPAEEK